MRAFFENRKDKGDFGFAASQVFDISFFAHWHKEIEILYVLEGEIGVGLNKEYRILKKGEMAVSEGNEIHYYNSMGENTKAYMIIFPQDMLSLKSLGVRAKPASYFFGDESDGFDSELAQNILAAIVKEARKKETLQKQMISLMLSELFVHLFRSDKRYFAQSEKVGKKENKKISLEPMQRALKYIEESYQSELSLEDTAQRAGLSPYYFSRLFKKTTGTNYNTYLNQVRVDNAEYLIKTTNEHIIDIAFKTGFKSIRTFNRVFKNLRGITPHNIRQEN